MAPAIAAEKAGRVVALVSGGSEEQERRGSDDEHSQHDHQDQQQDLANRPLIHGATVARCRAAVNPGSLRRSSPPVAALSPRNNESENQMNASGGDVIGRNVGSSAPD